MSDGPFTKVKKLEIPLFIIWLSAVWILILILQLLFVEEIAKC